MGTLSSQSCCCFVKCGPRPREQQDVPKECVAIGNHLLYFMLVMQRKDVKDRA